MARRGRGEGSITQRKDGRWQARLSLPGGVRKSFYGATRAEAEKKMREAQMARDEYLPIPGAKLTLDVFLKSWLRHIKHRELSPSTIAFYELYVNLHIIPALGKTPLVKLTPEILEDFYAAKLESGMSATSVRHLHSVLRIALKRAVRQNKVARNVAQIAEPPKAVRKEIRTLSWSEAHRFLEATKGNRLEALYVIAVTTGARQGEILGLRWQHVDLDAGTIQIAGALQRISKKVAPPKHATVLSDRFIILKPKTKQSNRLIRLLPKAVDALREHKRQQHLESERAGSLWRDFDLVFSNEVGGPIESTHLLKRSYRPLLKLADLPPITFHELRHTCASLLLEEGIHPSIVADLLGHARTSTTLDIYSHVAPSLTEGIPSLMTAKLDQISSELASELASNCGERENLNDESDAKSSVN